MGFWTALKSIFGGKSEKEKVLDEAMQEAQVELDKFEPKKGFKPVEMNIEKTKPKRARTKKGRYVKDDKSTPNINEAWIGGKAPKKTTKKKKKVGRPKKKK
mgnify:CR=1 FL=1|tara:strand:- start:230 stop:532 length:303 start_codon:yes stop_codon:yes gene_type:complete